jgi:uncharacterized protein
MQGEKRYQQLDAIRGLALVGIFIVNIVYFCNVSEGVGDPKWLSSFINFLQNELFGGRSATIFAFLFGLGMSMQWNKWKSSGFLLKRTLILALIGMFHIFLLFSGDILLDYALFGLAGVLIVKLKPKTILAIAVLVGLYTTLYMTIKFLGWLPANSPGGGGGESTDLVQLYKNGSYWDQCNFRLGQYFNIRQIPWVRHNYFPPVFACFILGIYLAKTDFLESLHKIKFYKKIFWITFSLKLLLTLVNHIEIAFFLALKKVYLFQIWMHWDQYITSALLFSLVVISMGSHFSRFWKPFQTLGRTSLTTYILQSVFSGILFYSYGFKQYDQFSPVKLQGVALVILLLIWLFNHLWLQRFRRGPLEEVWRKFSGRDRMVKI